MNRFLATLDITAMVYLFLSAGLVIGTSAGIAFVYTVFGSMAAVNAIGSISRYLKSQDSSNG